MPDEYWIIPRFPQEPGYIENRAVPVNPQKEGGGVTIGIDLF
jgi:hypothetical protein